MVCNFVTVTNVTQNQLSYIPGAGESSTIFPVVGLDAGAGVPLVERVSENNGIERQLNHATKIAITSSCMRIAMP